MRKSRVIIAGAVAVLLIAVAAYVANPLRRPEDTIRASLLRDTPLGSSVSEVRATVERRGWLNRSYCGNTGYVRQQPGRPGEVVGVSSISGHLGHYGFPFRTDATAFWGFDERGRLIDIWVWKTTDAL